MSECEFVHLLYEEPSTLRKKCGRKLMMVSGDLLNICWVKNGFSLLGSNNIWLWRNGRRSWIYPVSEWWGIKEPKKRGRWSDTRIIPSVYWTSLGDRVLIWGWSCFSGPILVTLWAQRMRSADYRDWINRIFLQWVFTSLVTQARSKMTMLGFMGLKTWFRNHET